MIKFNLNTLGGHIKYTISVQTWKEKREICARLSEAFGKPKRNKLEKVHGGDWSWEGDIKHQSNALYTIFLTTEEQAVYVQMAFEIEHSAEMPSLR